MQTSSCEAALSTAVGLVEGALAKSIPVAIGFLAGLLGLGDPAAPVRTTIEKARSPVEKAIDWVISLAVKGLKAAGGFVKGLFGGKKKKGRAEEPSAPTDIHVSGVKAAAKGDLQARLGGSISSYDEANTAISAVFQAYRDEGLDELDIKLNKSGKFDIYARASARTLLIGDVEYTISEDEKEKKQQLIDLSSYLNPQTNVTSILVGINGVAYPASPIQSSRGEKHADVQFVDDHLPEISNQARQRYIESQRKTTVSLTLNRNPCSACAPAIGSAQQI